ncbi:MAG: hypothetical protein OHK0029_35880 [Armatimonadaceae bacterium]
MPGVKSATVDANTQTANLETDKGKPTDVELKETVKKAGYSVVKVARAIAKSGK